MKNSKAKGASFERAICKQLSLWLTQGKREDVLWRSAMSGGRATVAHRKGKDVRQCGDICAVGPEGHEFCQRYFLELKHVKRLALDQFLVKGTGPLANFWRVAKREAAKHKRQPILIARQNGWPIIVLSDALLPWTSPFIQSKDVFISLLDAWNIPLFHAWGVLGTTPTKRIPRE
jgi:hypothetical protein